MIGQSKRPPPLAVVAAPKIGPTARPQSPAKGFLRELLADAEPPLTRIMSMNARRPVGTCRCPVLTRRCWAAISTGVKTTADRREDVKFNASLIYETGQFGKNDLGDRDRYLPTVHGSMNIFAGSIISTRRMIRSGIPVRRPVGYGAVAMPGNFEPQ